jgi:hypothetical protein
MAFVQDIVWLGTDDYHWYMYETALQLTSEVHVLPNCESPHDT